MSEHADDLKATAEDLIDDAERLKRIEQAKLELKPGDPRLVELAEEGDRLARRMRDKAHAERDVAAEAKGD